MVCVGRTHHTFAVVVGFFVAVVVVVVSVVGSVVVSATVSVVLTSFATSVDGSSVVVVGVVNLVF